MFETSHRHGYFEMLLVREGELDLLHQYPKKKNDARRSRRNAGL